MQDNDFKVTVEQVSDVQPHPNSVTLDIVTINGKTNVANRPSPNQPRYKIGDYAVVLQEGLVLPDDLLKHLDMWDETKNKGCLAGSKGNRTKARKVAGIVSEVALCAVDWTITGNIEVPDLPGFSRWTGRLDIDSENNRSIIKFKLARQDENISAFTPEGIDVSRELGIVPHVPQ